MPSDRLLSYSFAGSQFVFGELGAKASKFGVVFAFQVLPIIIFIAAFFSILYYYGVMQFIIRQLAKVMMRFMGASGVESLNVAASIFMGHHRSAADHPPVPAQGHALRADDHHDQRHGACLRRDAGRVHSAGHRGSAPAGGSHHDRAGHHSHRQDDGAGDREAAHCRRRTNSTSPNWKQRPANVLDAATKGTTDGLFLALNVAAMLISFLAIIALMDGVLGGTHNFLAAHGFRWFPGKLETIFGVIFAPVAWLIGVPWHDCLAIGNLLGTRMVLNELVAYTMLSGQKAALDPRSFTIATFALCGFANLASIGIVIGGLSSLAPTRRHDLAKLGFRAMIAGTMAESDVGQNRGNTDAVLAKSAPTVCQPRRRRHFQLSLYGSRAITLRLVRAVLRRFPLTGLCDICTISSLTSSPSSNDSRSPCGC